MMNTTIQKAMASIDALSTRERVMLLGAVIVVCVFVTVNSVLIPVGRAAAVLEGEIIQKRDQVDFFRKEMDRLVAMSKADPDQANRDRLKSLEATLRTVDTNLAQFTHGMVSPKQMPELIEGVLRRENRLQLISMENLAVEPLGVEQPTDTSKPVEAVLFRHGLKLKLRGRYPDMVRYLKAMESLPWNVFWGRVWLQSITPPESELELVLYTISMKKAWAGV